MRICGFLTVILGAAAAFAPAPYAIESPGPTFNTIGQANSRPLIRIQGRETFPVTGRLDLTTVYVNGGPDAPVGIGQVMRAWVDPDQSVTPVELVYPPDITPAEIQEQNSAAMTSSQEAAVAAALGYLEIPFEETLSVAGVMDGAAAQGILRPGDVMVAIDGTPVTNIGVLRRKLNAAAGSSVELKIRRDGATTTQNVTPRKAGSGDYQLGVGLVAEYDFPFKVTIALDDVGGPSAGSMFALGIVDKLTEGPLTGGKHFAGTGTIDSSGRIGPIGGIRQKLRGARSAGAEAFLVPAANCSEAAGHIPDGLRAVRVRTLDDAVRALETLADDGDASASLPGCAG
jgi:PDZ domain-containing protein